MAYTHVEIEQHKTRHLVALFIGLTSLYTGSILLIVALVRLWIGLPAWPGAWVLLKLFGSSMAVAALHWMVSTHRMLERIVASLDARPPDSQDTYHVRFLNLVQEVSIATGGRMIQAYVIPTPAVNACAASDFDGRAVLAVTEGALAMLSRAQLESVVGHEAAHIVSGDSLSVTIVCSLFAMHEAALKRVRQLFSGESRVRMRGSGALLIVLVIGILALTVFMKRVVEMLVSREKEYRADAVAVRLTRNPLALAEALERMTRRWRGVGTPGEALASLFVLDPGVEAFSEREGVLANLFSTHPPTGHRIGLLLGMAGGVKLEQFAQEVAERERHPAPRRMPESDRGELRAPSHWRVWLDGAWQGPLGLEALGALSALRPDTWVAADGTSAVMPAHQDPQLLQVLKRRHAGLKDAVGWDCPACRVPLAWRQYEGAPIRECPECRGCYVDPAIITRTFSRREYAFPEPVERQGRLLLAQEHTVAGWARLRTPAAKPLQLQCPACGEGMVRKFYTEAYAVEVDQCWSCRMTWLDHEELELLQYVYESRTAVG